MNRWPQKKLGEVASVIRGVSFDKQEASDKLQHGYLPILRAGNIGDFLDTDHDLVWVPETRITEQQRLRPGDVAICMSSGSPQVVGKSAQLNKEWYGSVGAFCAIIRFRTVNSRFGALFLLSLAFLAWRDGQAKGANIQNLRKAELEHLHVPVPPPAEQERIVRILDEADQLRRLRAEADRRTAELIPALFNEMFGDASINARNFRWFKIGDLTELVTSGLTPLGGAENYTTDGPYFFRSQNVQMNRIDFEDIACLPLNIHESMGRTKVREGDVLLNITGASIGRVAWVEKLEREANVNQHVCIIRPKQDVVLPPYLSVFLSTPYGQEVINQTQAGASRQGLNHEQVRSITVMVPPVSEQRVFAARVTEIRAMGAEQAASRRGLDDLFQSLLHRAFQGEL